MYALSIALSGVSGDKADESELLLLLKDEFRPLSSGLRLGLPALNIVGELAMKLCSCRRRYIASSSLSGDILAKSGSD